MPVQDLIAIASFVIAIVGIVYAFGKRDESISTLKKDVNNLGQKVDDFDKRLDRLNEFFVRLDQRVLQLQEQTFGDEKTDRLREINNQYYSPNSGIDL